MNGTSTAPPMPTSQFQSLHGRLFCILLSTKESPITTTSLRHPASSTPSPGGSLLQTGSDGRVLFRLVQRSDAPCYSSCRLHRSSSSCGLNGPALFPCNACIHVVYKRENNRFMVRWRFAVWVLLPFLNMFDYGMQSIMLCSRSHIRITLCVEKSVLRGNNFWNLNF